jgi:hypothetical protein
MASGSSLRPVDPLSQHYIHSTLRERIVANRVIQKQAQRREGESNPIGAADPYGGL